MSLYIRAGASAANLVLRVVVRGADLAADAVRMAVPATEQPVWVETEDAVVQSSARTSEPLREVDDGQPASRPVDGSAGRAKTIDDEPELVAEVAEPGAEDGAGAELEVDQPWEGYNDLTAEEAIARIGGADAAELAVIELYERSHKQRRTVLAAVERRSKALANAPS
jgi:hypothetical protein